MRNSFDSKAITQNFAAFHQNGWDPDLDGGSHVSEGALASTFGLERTPEVFRIPGTQITGHVMKPIRANPLAPIALVPDADARLASDPIHKGVTLHLNPSTVLILQVPEPHQRALREAQQAHPGALALLDDPKTHRITALNSLDDMRNIKPAKDLPPAERPRGSTGEALFKLDGAGHVLGQISFLDTGYQWLQRSLSGVGYISIQTDARNAVLRVPDENGFPTDRRVGIPLSGAIRIAAPETAPAPGEISYELAVANMRSQGWRKFR